MRFHRGSALALILAPLVLALSGDRLSSPPREASKVLVTGAGGRTGSLIFDLLLHDRRYDPVAMVRTEASGRRLRRQVSDCGLENIVVCDVTNEADVQSVASAAAGCTAMVICTSSSPRVRKRSLVNASTRVAMNLLLNRFRSNKRHLLDFRHLRFKFRAGQHPQKVDYEGQVRQMELAKGAGVGHVVLLSSLGVTDPNHVLNSVGKNPDGSGDGDILVWKRRAEKHLVESGMKYTIFHPGGLVDTPLQERQMQVRFDVDDRFAAEEERSMDRSTLAKLCVASLSRSSTHNISFDCVMQSAKDHIPGKLPEAAFADFLETGKSAIY